MKKILLSIPVLCLIMSCSGKKDQKSAEAIEKSTQNLEQVVQSSAAQIDSAQTEIDKLLEGI